MITLAQIKKLWEQDGESKRRSKVRELKSIYQGDWLSLLVERIHHEFQSRQVQEQMTQMADCSYNVLRYIADEMGGVYGATPVRSFADESEENKDLVALSLLAYEASGKTNMTLDASAKLNYALREVILRVRACNGELDLEVISPDRVAVFCDPTSATNVLAILQKTETGYHYWDNETHLELDSHWSVIIRSQDGIIAGKLRDITGIPNEFFLNPYGQIPFVICHAQYPALSFWNQVESYSLRETNYNTAISQTSQRHIEKYQSYIQGWIKGGGEQGSKVVASVVSDVSEWVKVPMGGDIGTLDLQANLVALHEVLQKRVESQLALQGLSPSAVRGNSVASSGYALRVERQSQEQVWEEQRTLWRMFENEIYQTFRVILFVDTGTEIIDNELKVEFSPLGVGTSKAEAWEIAKGKLELGVMSKKQYFLSEGYSEDEALAIIEEIKMESQPTAQE